MTGNADTAPPLALSVVVRVLEVAPIDAVDGWDALRFRIEILRRLDAPRSFHARVWRVEHYRVRPSFPGPHRRGSVLADELLLVEDVGLGGPFTGRSAAEVQRKVVERIMGVFLAGDGC